MLLHYLGKSNIQIFCRYSADTEENANKLHFECTDFNSSMRVTVCRIYGWKGALGRFTWQSAERPRLRTLWHKEAHYCRWALAALSPGVQQVADNLSGRVKARLFFSLFRSARHIGRWSLLPGRATETADAASHAPYCWWHVRVPAG